MEKTAEGLREIFMSAPVLMAALAAASLCAFYFSFSCAFAFAEFGKNPSQKILEKCGRDIFALKVLAGVSPLLGLLGTIVGISQCVSSAGDAKMLADGISCALLTTQTGLVLAVPEWIAAVLLSSRLGTLREKFASTGGAK